MWGICIYIRHQIKQFGQAWSVSFVKDHGVEGLPCEELAYSSQRRHSPFRHLSTLSTHLEPSRIPPNPSFSHLFPAWLEDSLRRSVDPQTSPTSLQSPAAPGDTGGQEPRLRILFFTHRNTNWDLYCGLFCLLRMLQAPQQRGRHATRQTFKDTTINGQLTFLLGRENKKG